VFVVAPAMERYQKPPAAFSMIVLFFCDSMASERRGMWMRGELPVAWSAAISMICVALGGRTCSNAAGGVPSSETT
jgi:hypothetical protein